MKVSDILRIKGSKVKTVTPDTSARELSVRLHSEQIGAMIVSGDGRTIQGSLPNGILLTVLRHTGANCQRLPFLG